MRTRHVADPACPKFGPDVRGNMGVSVVSEKTTMPVPIPDVSVDLSDLPINEWFNALDHLGEEHGYFEPLGDDHSAIMIDAGPKLLVTFETVDSIRKRRGAKPRSFDMVTRNGWSVLTVIAHRATWFRNERVYRFIDRQTDDGFFEDFDQVLFYGEHAGGYAAAAYSVAAPGARVLALRPVATLDPDVARWDRRYMNMRTTDFTTRYGYGPDMVEASRDTYIVADPTATADAVHSALYRRPNVTRLSTPYVGPRIEQFCDALDITPKMMEAAIEGRLTPSVFGQMWRARRQLPPYLRSLLKRLENAGRNDLALRLCAHGMSTREADMFAAKRDALLSLQGTAAE